MKKLLKIILILVGISILGFGIYVYKLHSLAVAGNKIFELRCTTVNPPLIAYKNSFLKFANYVNSPDKQNEDEAMKSFFEDYFNSMREYVVQESKWLETNRQYLNRWDFKLIEPWYIKQAGDYQLKMYEGYRDDALGLLAILDKNEPDDKLTAKHLAARKRRDEAEEKYFDFFDKAVEISDWRKMFSNIPIPKGCTEENMTIPQTGGAIDWEGTPTPQPKGIPGVEGLSG